jgi:hypothetical protein
METSSKGRKSLFKTILRLLGRYILIETVILGVLYLVGTRVGWGSSDQYGGGLQIAGMLIVGVGFFGVKGNWDGTRSFGYQYSMTVSDQSSWERTQQTLLDFAQAFRFLLSSLLIGGINVLLGMLI